MQGRFEAVRELFLKKVAEANKPIVDVDLRIKTLLEKAMQLGEEEKAILEFLGNPDHQLLNDGLNGKFRRLTPVQLALRMNAGPTLMRVLIRRAHETGLWFGDDYVPDGNALLHTATIRGRIDVIQTIIPLIPEVDEVGITKAQVLNQQTKSEGWTPLHCALLGSQVEIANLLLGAKAVVNIKDSHGIEAADILVLRVPALIAVSARYAAKCGTAESVQFYIKIVLKLETKLTADEQFARTLLLQKNRQRMLILLMQRAIETGDLDTIQQVLKEDEKLIGIMNQMGETVLHLSVRFRQLKVTRFFIQRKVSTVAEDRRGRTPFHYVACYASPDFLDLFLEADYKKRDGLGKSMVYLAARYGNLQMLAFLMTEGSVSKHLDFPLYFDAEGRSILHAVVGNVNLDLDRQLKVVEFILNCYICLAFYPDIFGDTPLKFCSRKSKFFGVDKKEVSTLLIEHMNRETSRIVTRIGENVPFLKTPLVSSYFHRIIGDRVKLKDLKLRYPHFKRESQEHIYATNSFLAKHLASRKDLVDGLLEPSLDANGMVVLNRVTVLYEEQDCCCIALVPEKVLDKERVNVKLVFYEESFSERSRRRCLEKAPKCVNDFILGLQLAKECLVVGFLGHGFGGMAAQYCLAGFLRFVADNHDVKSMSEIELITLNARVDMKVHQESLALAGKLKTEKGFRGRSYHLTVKNVRLSGDVFLFGEKCDSIEVNTVVLQDVTLIKKMEFCSQEIKRLSELIQKVDNSIEVLTKQKEELKAKIRENKIKIESDKTKGVGEKLKDNFHGAIAGAVAFLESPSKGTKAVTELLEDPREKQQKEFLSGLRTIRRRLADLKKDRFLYQSELAKVHQDFEALERQGFDLSIDFNSSQTIMPPAPLKLLKLSGDLESPKVQGNSSGELRNSNERGIEMPVAQPVMRAGVQNGQGAKRRLTYSDPH